MNERHHKLSTYKEDRDEGTDRLFGEFDPEEFEILDEVGGDELIEQPTQIPHSSQLNHLNEEDKPTSPNKTHNSNEKSTHYSDISAAAQSVGKT